MTEKHYGGNSGVNNSGGIISKNIENAKLDTKKKKENSKKTIQNQTNLENSELNNLKKAGEIAKKAREYGVSIIKKDSLLIEIVEKVEQKIIELGGFPAFPVTISIDEVAAHATPAFNSTEKARGLLKLDLGVHISGDVADTAISIDLENSEENKNLILASEKALNSALKMAKKNSTISEVGEIIEKEIESSGFTPIRNLSGHSIENYNVHAGLTIPNYKNNSIIELEQGVFAIEPFATTGLGKIKEGKPSGIYQIIKEGNVRDEKAREVLQYIIDNYQTLPFCSRWIYKQFGARGLLALKQIESAGILHHFPELIEVSGKKVSQAEHTLVLTESDKIITTI